MIKSEVETGHLRSFPEERPLIEKIASEFDVTWARRLNEMNAQVSCYFIKPKPETAEYFGFSAEILLCVSEYPKAQARTVQAIEKVLSQVPARGRVDQTVAILISGDKDVKKWLSEYLAENPQSRTIVGISSVDLHNIRPGSWDLKNLLSQQIFNRDLFGFQLPVREDIFFFGRVAAVRDYTESIRRRENRGLFGLRKTGKTSLLFKIQRDIGLDGFHTLYYDCKLPAIYRDSAESFLDRICQDIVDAHGRPISGWKGQKSAWSRFERLVQALPEDFKLLLVFDEIEYISFTSPTAPNWHDDFVPFWQTIWSVQSAFSQFSFIIAGVNARVAEEPTVGSIQNPLFGIVKPNYLIGLDTQELRQMINSLGRRSGLWFDAAAVKWLETEYGGHPLLTRMICSKIDARVRSQRAARPFQVTAEYIRSHQLELEEEVLFYCAHIVSELKLSYDIEYEMLEMVAIENLADFNVMAVDQSLVRHLRAYGILSFGHGSSPSFRIPLLKRYIGRQWAVENHQAIPLYVVEKGARDAFVLQAVRDIARDLRSLDKLLATRQVQALFGIGGPPEIEKFLGLTPVASEADLKSFLTQCYRTLIDGARLSQKPNTPDVAGFFRSLLDRAPDIWAAFARVKAYRNRYEHTELKPFAEIEYSDFRKRDLADRDPEQLEDGHFRVQQAVLNGLVHSLQLALTKYE